MTGDLINAAFEAGGAILLAFNVFRLWRDRRLAGVSILPTAWMAAWGLWNLAYYPSLGQWASFTAGLAVVAANTTCIKSQCPRSVSTLSYNIN